MVTIPDDLLIAAHLTEDELKRELAVLLYSKKRLTFAQARRLTGMNRWEFQDLLYDHQVPMHYSIKDLHQDIETLRKLDEDAGSK